jgi:hypothetical protein
MEKSCASLHLSRKKKANANETHTSNTTLTHNNAPGAGLTKQNGCHKSIE